MSTRLILVLLLATLFAPGMVQAEKAVHLALEIDYGVEVFARMPALPGPGDTEALIRLLDASPEYPLHAALIRDFVSRTVAGNRDISQIKEDLQRLHDQILLRFSPHRPATVFDRALVTVFLATYQNDGSSARLHALRALNDFSLLLALESNEAWFHLFYTIGYASLASIDGVDISDYRGNDPLAELRRSLMMENRDPWFHYVAGQSFITLSADSPDIHQMAFSEFLAARKLAPANVALQEAVHRVFLELLGQYEVRRADKPFWLEEAVYAEILRREPDNPAAMNNLAFLYGRYDHELTRAVELARRAHELQPNQAAFLDTLGFVLVKMGEQDAGLARLQEAHRLNPEDSDNHRHLSDIYLMRNDNASALPHLEWLLEREPKSDLLANNLAYTLSELNRDLDRALKLVDAALEFQPDSPVYLDTKGWILFKMGMSEQGETLIRQALEKEPGIGALHIHLGDIAFCRGELNGAVEHYLTGLRLEPGFPRGGEWLGKLCTIREIEAILTKNGRQVDWKKQIRVPFQYDQYQAILEFLNRELIGSSR